MIPGSANPLLLASAGGAPSYSIDRSLRFNSSDSAYLSRTPASAGNRKTWTWAGWVKRSALGSTQVIFSAFSGGGSNYFLFQFTSADILNVFLGPSVGNLTTNSVYRDASAWYHITLTYDTTQAVSTDRIKIYVNGAQVTSFSAATYPSLDNASNYVNSTVIHYLSGSYSAPVSDLLNGYLADIHFIDGQALTPSSFGEFDTNGIWQPKAFSGGSYGTNGFHLDFADNSAATAAALGKDTSGNGNNWTPNNLSVTAGAGNDSLVDSPTNGTASSGGDAGGVVVGNYATFNALTPSGVAATNGNLDVSITSKTAYGTIDVTSGKFYWEITISSIGGSTTIGIMNSRYRVGGTGWATEARGYRLNGQKWTETGLVSYGASYTTGDVIGVALDMDAATVTFYKNGSSQGTAFTDLAGESWTLFVYEGATTGSSSLNAGQRPFAYAAPAGFKSLNTANLPTPTILKGSDYFDTKLYTGNGSTQTISGLAFSPDLVWLKNRTSAYNHGLWDVIRGATKALYSSLTDAETTESGLSAFNSDGFSVGSSLGYNKSSDALVAWCWDAGSSNSTNTQGSITSTVRANASAGFSIVTYTGSLTGNGTSTVGHGLGAAPSLVITKRRDGTSNWCAQHISTSSASQILFLDTTDAQYSVSTYGTLSRPTSSVFSVNYTTGLGINGQTHVAYCFAPVAGYSSFGSYTGNGSADGPFVYTGFRPRWVMIKRSDSTGSWFLFDAVRSTYNETRKYLLAESSNAEGDDGDITNGWQLDLLSNGFKIRADAALQLNANGGVYVFAALAENPFSIARAR